MKKIGKNNKNVLYSVRNIVDLKDLFESNAKLYGDNNAFMVKRKLGGPYTTISFNQALEDMNALGTAFMEMDMQGKHIAVIGENRYEWVITYIATVCGVGVIVPIDRELPAHEMKYLLEQGDVSVIMYSGKVESKVEEIVSDLDSIEYLFSMETHFNELIDLGKKLMNKGDLRFVNAVVDPEVLSILLFTSGTMGLAKGVMLSHKNICANVMNMSMYVNVETDDVGLSVLPIHHTYEFTCHIMTCLFQGGCVAFCEGLKHIVKNMAEAKATIMLGVPLIFESMHNKVWKNAAKSGKAAKMQNAVNISKTLNKLNIKSTKKLFKAVHEALGGHARMFISGAAAIDPAVIENFNAMGFNMFQGYGMTECSPIIAVNKDSYHKAASVGPPMPGTEIKIIEPDENGIGEVVCKSGSVMLGYYKNPEETEKVLIDQWLYTGDFGYMDDEGFLYLTGRKKNVIVTKNGKNIFPEEVEFYLLQSPYISEVVVYGIKAENEEMIVCAEVFCDEAAILEDLGNLNNDDIYKLIGKEIDTANEKMALYKRVKRYKLKDEEFEKTTTKKIKRYIVTENKKTF